MFPGHPGHVSRHHHGQHPSLQYDQTSLQHAAMLQQQQQLEMLHQMGGGLSHGMGGFDPMRGHDPIQAALLGSAYHQQQMVHQFIEKQLRENQEKVSQQNSSKKPRQRSQQGPRPHTPSYAQTTGRSQNPYNSLPSHGSHGIHSQSPYDRSSLGRSAATPHPGLSHPQPSHQPTHHQPTHHHRSQSDALAQMRLAEERQREMYRLSSRTPLINHPQSHHVPSHPSRLPQQSHTARPSPLEMGHGGLAGFGALAASHHSVLGGGHPSSAHHLSGQHMSTPTQNVPQSMGHPTNRTAQLGSVNSPHANHNAHVSTNRAADPLRDNPFMSWNKPTAHPPPPDRPPAIVSNKNNFQIKEEIESEPVRVIAPSLLREREKKNKEEAKKKQRHENKTFNGHSNHRTYSSHGGQHGMATNTGLPSGFSAHPSNSNGMMTSQKYEAKQNVPYQHLIRPPIIHSPLNLSKTSISSTAPTTSKSTLPSSIPPFELLPPPTHSNLELATRGAREQTTPTSSAHDTAQPRESSTGGLTGPIYRREELIKKEPPTPSQILTNENETKVSRDSAHRRRPSGKPTEMELFARAMTQRDDISVDDWIISMLKSNTKSKASNSSDRVFGRVETREVWVPPNALLGNRVRPEIIRTPTQTDDKSRTVAETYPLLAKAISKVQDRIWVPDSNPDDSLNDDSSGQNPMDQSQSALSLLSRPLKALPPPLNGPYPSTSSQKQRKFENNKRAASPSGRPDSASDRKRSKSNAEEEIRRRIKSDSGLPEQIQRPNLTREELPRKFSHDSQKRRKDQIKIEPEEIKKEFQSSSLGTGQSSTDTSQVLADNYDSESETSETRRNKPVRNRVKKEPKKIKEETKDQKIMRVINRTAPGDLPPNVKKLSCKVSAGETLLHAASRRGYLENIAYYLELGMGIDSCDNAGFTALHEAVTKGHYECVELLLQQGANPNVQSTDGTRPIHDAAENGDCLILRLLLSYGGDPTLTSYTGETTLQLAVESAATALSSKADNYEDHEKTRQLLEEYMDYICEANNDDVIGYPGEPRDIDLYEEDSLGSIPSGDEESFEIEISDDPLPVSYWLTIDDRSENFCLMKDVESKIAGHDLEVKDLPFKEFSKQVNSCSFANMPSGLDPEENVKLVLLNDQFRNLLGSKTWSSSKSRAR